MRSRRQAIGIYVRKSLSVKPLAGRRHVEVTERRTAVDFAYQLKGLTDEHYPEAEVIVLVTDNLTPIKP